MCTRTRTVHIHPHPENFFYFWKRVPRSQVLGPSILFLVPPETENEKKNWKKRSEEENPVSSFHFFLHFLFCTSNPIPIYSICWNLILISSLIIQWDYSLLRVLFTGAFHPVFVLVSPIPFYALQRDHLSSENVWRHRETHCSEVWDMPALRKRSVWCCVEGSWEEIPRRCCIEEMLRSFQKCNRCAKNVPWDHVSAGKP